MTILYIFIASAAVMLVSLAGIVTVSRVFREWAERNLKYLTTFATGVFIILAYNLVAETFHSSISVTPLLGIVAVGAIIAFAIDKLIPDAHHHHDSGEDSGAHSKAGAQRIIFSDFLHNITDGFLIVPAFLVDVRLGLLATGGIMIHEVAQEISEFFVLKSAGYSTKKALIINLATSASILIGVTASLLISNISEEIIFILLAVAAGVIIYTIIKDLIPHSVAVAKKEKTYGKHIIAALIGALVILTLTSVTADSHVHSEHSHTEEVHIEDEHSHDLEHVHDHEHEHHEAH